MALVSIADLREQHSETRDHQAARGWNAIDRIAMCHDELRILVNVGQVIEVMGVPGRFEQPPVGWPPGACRNRRTRL